MPGHQIRLDADRLAQLHRRAHLALEVAGGVGRVLLQQLEDVGAGEVDGGGGGEAEHLEEGGRVEGDEEVGEGEDDEL